MTPRAVATVPDDVESESLSLCPHCDVPASNDGCRGSYVTRMLKRVFLTVLAVTGLLFAGVTAPATADSSLTIQSIRVTADPLRPGYSSRVVVTVDFGGTSGFTLDEPMVALYSDAGYGYALAYLEPTGRYDVWQATTYVPADVSPGKWWVDVYAWADWANGDYDYVDAAYAKAFAIKRATDLTADAGPEPVSRGDRIRVTGVLERVTLDSWGRPVWRPFAGQTVLFYFDPAGSATRRYMGTATTNSAGAYSRSFTATGTGRWYVEYKGNVYYMADKPWGDDVRVR